MRGLVTAIGTTETSDGTMLEDGSEERTIMTTDGSEIAAAVQDETEAIVTRGGMTIGSDSAVVVLSAIAIAGETGAKIGTGEMVVMKVDARFGHIRPGSGPGCFH